jgi:Fe-S cluster biogenesis protein NfuA
MMFETDAFRSAAMTDPKPSVEEQIITLIDQLNAYIEQYHGGSVELDRIDGNQVYVRLGGACEDCPLSPATLQGWVAGTLRQFFPDVEVIQAD